MNEVLNISGVECYEQDGTAYLKLETVARGLGFTDNSKGTEYVRWNTVRNYLSEIGFSQEVAKDSFIPENIFYRLAMKAKNEIAEKFQAKVADEIIPSIRKHGAYMTPETLEAAIMNPDTMIRLCEQLKAEQEKNKMLKTENDRMKPKEIFADSVANSDTCILIGELAKILKQNGIQIGQNRLFTWLRENGYLISRNGIDRNAPTQKAMELGLFKVKERAINNPDGSTKITKTTLVTGKGQQYFINKFLAEKEPDGEKTA